MYVTAPDDVTIVVLPKDRPSGVLGCLDALLRHTPPGFHLLVPDLGYPAPLRQEIQRRLDGLGGPQRSGQMPALGRILPLQALHKVLPLLRTGLCAVLSADLRVTPRWLEPLLRCIDDGADVATPLLLLHGEGGGAPEDTEETPAPALRGPRWSAPPHLRRIHREGQTFLLQYRPCGPSAELHEDRGGFLRERPRERAAADLLDLDCALLRADWLGRLELRPLSIYEGLDLGLQLRLLGARLIHEPRALVLRGEDPGAPTVADVEYALFRWSSARAARSMTCLRRAWGYGIEGEAALARRLRRRKLYLLGRLLGATPRTAARLSSRLSPDPATATDAVADSAPLLRRPEAPWEAP